MGVSRTLNPSVCFNREKQFGWAGGYFGNGVGASNLAGRTMADLILERDTDRVHTRRGLTRIVNGNWIKNSGKSNRFAGSVSIAVHA